MTQYPIALLSDIPQPQVSTGPGTYLASGGSVAYRSGLTFSVSGGTAIINYAGVNFLSTSVTLGTADVTNPRLDAIVVNDAGVVSVVPGTAAGTPALPDLDPLTQLALTYILVPAGASSLNIVITNVYLENTEWTSSVSGGTVNAASTSNPFAGTKDIEFTAAASGDWIKLTNGTAVDLSSVKQVNFQIRSKAAFPKPKSILVTFYNGSTKVGQSVAVSDKSFGFDSSITSGYQAISIPLSQFVVPIGQTVTVLEFKVNGSGAAIGFYLDNITLQSTSVVTAPPQTTNPDPIIIPVSDESTAITTGTAVVTMRMPFGGALVGVRGNLNTASTSGTPTFDVKNGGVSVFTTLLTIDANEKTSQTAATPAVIDASKAALNDDAEITIDITVAGTGAKGAKITLFVRRT